MVILTNLLVKFKEKKSWLWFALCILAIIVAIISSGCVEPPSLPDLPEPPAPPG